MERNYMAKGSKDHGIICRRSTNQNSGMLKDYSWSQISQTRVGFGEGDLHQDQNSNSGPGGGVFSWPPRSYSCSFCKREFRSAQALGGHMNVHRRDRARLRQSSPLMDNNNNNVGQFTTASHPPLNLNLCPNHFSPNPSYNNNHDDGGEDDVVSPPTNCTGFSSVVSASSPGPALSSSSSKRFAYLGEDKINQVGNVVEGALLIDPLSSRGADFAKKGVRKSFFGTEKSAAGFKPRDGCKFLKNGAMVRLDLEIGVLGDHTKEELDLELRLGCS